MLPHKRGVSIVGLIGTLLGLDKAASDDLHNHHFKGLAVTLVHSQQEARKHDKNHDQGRRAVGNVAAGQKIQRDAYQQRPGKTNQLPFGQPKHNFGFYVG